MCVELRVPGLGGRVHSSRCFSVSEAGHANWLTSTPKMARLRGLQWGEGPEQPEPTQRSTKDSTFQTVVKLQSPFQSSYITVAEVQMQACNYRGEFSSS